MLRVSSEVRCTLKSARLQTHSLTSHAHYTEAPVFIGELLQTLCKPPELFFLSHFNICYKNVKTLLLVVVVVTVAVALLLIIILG